MRTLREHSIFDVPKFPVSWAETKILQAQYKLGIWIRNYLRCLLIFSMGFVASKRLKTPRLQWVNLHPVPPVEQSTAPKPPAV